MHRSPSRCVSPLYPSTVYELILVIELQYGAHAGNSSEKSLRFLGQDACTAPWWPRIKLLDTYHAYASLPF